MQTRYPWELLTVEEGKLLLSNSELINWVYQATTPSFVQPIINVGLWLRNQIDTVAQELGWMLMPAPALSSQMRDLQEGFDKIRVGLEAQGVHIPATARGAYRNLDSESGCLRLYAIMWVLSATEENSEWMLLVALGGQPNMQMPRNVKLEVRDERESLFAQSLENTSQAILYAQVIGNCDERFWVTVTANDTAIFEIPPFGLTVESII